MSHASKGKPSLRRRLRPFGLRWGRAVEWLRVVTADRGVTPRDVAAMATLAARSLVRSPRAGIVRDYRTCARCPYHDRSTRTCLGCGCYMPYKLAAGGGCWAREQDPASRHGFDHQKRENV